MTIHRYRHEYEAQPMTTFAPADVAEVPLENMLRVMINNSVDAIVVHVDGVEYEVHLKTARRVNRGDNRDFGLIFSNNAAYAPEPQHGCPCAQHRHS